MIVRLRERKIDIKRENDKCPGVKRVLHITRFAGRKSYDVDVHDFAIALLRCNSKATKWEGFKQGGFPIWTRPSQFVLSRPSLSFPNVFKGFARLVLCLFLGLLEAPTRNTPGMVRDTTRTFPESSGKPPTLWKPPGLPSRKQ